MRFLLHEHTSDSPAAEVDSQGQSHRARANDCDLSVQHRIWIEGNSVYLSDGATCCFQRFQSRDVSLFPRRLFTSAGLK